jgi:signal transduction histidine kinase
VAVLSPNVQINWRFKAILPVAATLLVGIALFFWVTLSIPPSDRRTVLLVAAGGAVVICAVLLAVLAVLVHRPLLELQEKIARLERGDLNVAVSFASRRDEIGELGRRFNETVRQLRETREELQRLHRTQMTRAEHLATLGELAAGLAHEIRNPLAGIAGVIEIIGRDLPANSSAREVLKDVEQEVRHIQKILNELLDYARPKPPQPRLADLNATAERAVLLARQQAASRPVEIEFRPANNADPVEHDPDAIQQVLLNLLLNALQAIEGRGKILVEVGAEGSYATVAVTDTGTGIPPQLLPNIFKPFYTTKSKGTGLGLSLARRIVEAHGGRIQVETETGRGSTFRVWLPRRNAALAEAAS